MRTLVHELNSELTLVMYFGINFGYVTILELI
jgi:hypothetical protein